VAVEPTVNNGDKVKRCTHEWFEKLKEGSITKLIVCPRCKHTAMVNKMSKCKGAFGNPNNIGG